MNRETRYTPRNLFRTFVTLQGYAGGRAAAAKRGSQALTSRLTDVSQTTGTKSKTAPVLGVAVLALLSSGCGGGMTSEEMARVTEETRSGLRIARRVATVLDFLHLLPKEACGEPEQSFATKIVPELERALGCAVVARTSESEQDVVRLSFPEQGCSYRGRAVTGTLVVAFNGGEDRTDLVLDFHELAFDGKLIPARGGYSECGDAQSYWADVAGELPQSQSRRYAVAGRFKQVDGLPIVGGDQASLDSSGVMATGDGTNRLRIAGLVLMLFKYPVPRHGELEIDLEDGRFIRARVQNESLDENLVEVEASIDDKPPVTMKVALDLPSDRP